MKLRTAFSALCLALLTAAVPGDAPTSPHFALADSDPKAGSTVHEVGVVTLRFTEEPQDGSVSIRLIDSAEEVVPAGEAVQSADDPRSFSVDPEGSLTNGTYTVSWRGMGADGHVVRDTFSFVVGHGHR